MVYDCRMFFLESEERVSVNSNLEYISVGKEALRVICDEAENMKV